MSKCSESFYYKVVKRNFDPGGLINICSAFAIVYKRNFYIAGEWKVLKGGFNDGSPVYSLLITDRISSYRRQKKVVGYKRDLPFW